MGVNRSPLQPISFEEALEKVSELEAATGSWGSAPFGEPQYGITQAVYSAWRRSQNQPLQNVSRISQEEVHAIYRSYWQQGNCDRYKAPLDLICLDSLISFGPKTGKQFLGNLPADPRAAALEVMRRRQAFRQQAANSARIPFQQQQWEAGNEHDRALMTFVEVYSTAEQSEFSAGLRRWLASVQSKPQPSAQSHPQSESPSQLAPEPSDSSQTQSSQTQSNASSSRASGSSATARLSSAQIYQQAKPFVVEVWISTSGMIAPAAGIILTSDGLVLTNYHVINEGSFDFVRSANGQDFHGTVIEVDPSLDLALIQLDNASRLPTAKLSNHSTHVNVGDTVYAIGSPLGSHWKMTEAAIIEVQSECGLPELQCLRTPKDFLKPGNSGGPLLDESGQVVGINRAIQDGTGEGVSIPIEIVKAFVGHR
jgi:S1-C subfamily serine protease